MTRKIFPSESQNGEALFATKSLFLGKVGAFTFYATCAKDRRGENEVAFKMTSSSQASIDGAPPVPAGTVVTLHTDSAILDSTRSHPLAPGAFAQFQGTSTEVSADRQITTVYYNDGVNWPTGSGKRHPCFAGYIALSPREAK